MALTDRLINAARVHLPGATDAAIAAELYSTVDEACREGFIWRETIDVPFVEGQASYSIAPVDAQVAQILWVTHPTLDVTGVTAEFGIVTVPFEVTAAHAADQPFSVVAVLTPTLGATDIESYLPQDMWSAHYRLLFSGLVSRMMFQPAKPFSNPQLAVGHRRVFLQLLADARHQAKTDRTPGAQLWRFPRYR